MTSARQILVKMLLVTPLLLCAVAWPRRASAQEWISYSSDPRNILEGHSLLPWLHATPPAIWRQHVFSEYDYAMQPARLALDQPLHDCRLFMVFDGRWKYIHATRHRPMLYDLAADPDEFHDLGADPRYEPERTRLDRALRDWALRDHARITMPDARIDAYVHGVQLRQGILIGVVDEEDLARVRGAGG